MKFKLSKNSVVITLVVILFIMSPLMGQIYITVNTGGTVGLAEDLMSIQLMAVDYNQMGETVLQRDGDRFTISLGEWFPDTAKTYPAAFAIINPEPEREFRINSINLVGESSLGNLEVWLHRNKAQPCNADLVNVDDIDPSGSLYYTGGSPLEVGGWVLGPGYGIGDGELQYSNDTITGTAALENGLWVHDTDGPRYSDPGSNFVWVEISVRPTYAAYPGDFTGPVNIEIVAEFEPVQGSTVEFMSSGRRQGSPVMYRSGENNITLSFNDMWAGTRVIIPDAFALVNAAPTPFVISGINIDTGEIDLSGSLEVYLHGNPDMVCSDIGLTTDPSAILYYPTNEGQWELGAGQGYDEDVRLIYGDTTAKRLGGHPDQHYYMWTYDEGADNIAVNGTDNFVWVELSFEVPYNSGDFSIEFSFQFTDA